MASSRFMCLSCVTIKCRCLSCPMWDQLQLKTLQARFRTFLLVTPAGDQYFRGRLRTYIRFSEQISRLISLIHPLNWLCGLGARSSLPDPPPAVYPARLQSCGCSCCSPSPCCLWARRQWAEPRRRSCRSASRSGWTTAPSSPARETCWTCTTRASWRTAPSSTAASPATDPSPSPWAPARWSKAGTRACWACARARRGSWSSPPSWATETGEPLRRSPGERRSSSKWSCWASRGDPTFDEEEAAKRATFRT